MLLISTFANQDWLSYDYNNGIQNRQLGYAEIQVEALWGNSVRKCLKVNTMLNIQEFHSLHLFFFTMHKSQWRLFIYVFMYKVCSQQYQVDDMENIASYLKIYTSQYLGLPWKELILPDYGFLQLGLGVVY